MPSVADNKKVWDGSHDWERRGRGEEWSQLWGGSQLQWQWSMLPRIRGFLPADTIVELACGYGRWSEFLKDHCRHLILVDLSERCIAACRTRFAGSSHISYYVNDGTSLAMLQDGSIDFLFSYDSLVHVDRETLGCYVRELSRVLAPSGAAFLHHSNLAAYPLLVHAQRAAPLRVALRHLGIWHTHWRDPEVRAEDVRTLAQQHGLTCARQELTNFSTTRQLIDCLSTITRIPSAGRYSSQALRNPHYMQEARNVARVGPLYGQPVEKAS